MNKEQTDVLIVRDFVRNTGGREFHFNEIVRGLNIVEYSGRISNVRTLFECTCGKDKKTCTAIEHIQNTRKCYYRYLCRKIAYEAEIKPSQIVRQQPVLPEKPEMNEEARARWEAIGALLKKPKLPVRNYGN